MSARISTLLVVSVSLGALPAARADQQPPPPADARPAPPNLTLPTPSLPPPAPPRQSPFRLDLTIDVPLLVVGTTLWTVPFFLVTPELPPPHCDPCDSADVNVIDRWSIRLHVPEARTIGDSMFYLLGPFLIALEMGDYGGRNYRAYLADMVVIGESLVLSGLLDEFVRRSVRRPRPYMYESGVYPERRETTEAAQSFYSGHTAAMFAFAVSTSWSFHMRHPSSRWRYVMWASLVSYATIHGLLRIVAGDHFLTDVAVGALAGTSMGLLVPALHRRPVGGVQMGLVPQVSYNSAGLSLMGRF